MSGIYCFTARTVNPENNQPLNIPVGAIQVFVLAYPGTQQEVMTYANQNKLGSPGVRYQIFDFPVKGNISSAAVLCVQIFTGQPVSAQGHVLSRQYIEGGMPYGPPHGNGPNRPGGPVDPRSHFQDLPDAAIPADEAAIYGNGDHGTYTDFIQGPSGGQEVPRVMPRT